MDLLVATDLYVPIVALCGLLIGSFLNVVILRLPARLEHEWRCQCAELLNINEPTKSTSAPPSLAIDRSKCPQCGHQLSAWENIPLLSYALLRGKCRACQTKISIRYPVIEAFTAAVFGCVAYSYGASWACGLMLVFSATLIALSGIDLDHKLLPDNLTLPLVWIGLIASTHGYYTSPVDSILGATIGYLILWSIFHIFKLLTGKEGMGYGDFKLLAAIGAWLGWQSLPLVILLSSLVGAVVGIGLVIFRRNSTDQAIPFGPFLASAGWIAAIWGDAIVESYFRFMGA